jgi:hypothetical protein
MTPPETADQAEDRNDGVTADQAEGQKEEAAKDLPEALPSKLTAGQFLMRSPKRPEIDGLLRALHKTKVMSLEEWEKETASLLKKKIS